MCVGNLSLSHTHTSKHSDLTKTQNINFVQMKTLSLRYIPGFSPTSSFPTPDNKERKIASQEKVREEGLRSRHGGYKFILLCKSQQK